MMLALPCGRPRSNADNTTILSRNVCLGSATYGGILDVVVEDCTIGDDEGSSPWAIKYKSHQGYPGTLKNHTWRRLKVGSIRSNTYVFFKGVFLGVFLMRLYRALRGCSCGSRGFRRGPDDGRHVDAVSGRVRS